MRKRDGLNAASRQSSHDRFGRGWERRISRQRTNGWPTSSAPAAGRFHAFRRRQPAGPVLRHPVLLVIHLVRRLARATGVVRALAPSGPRAAVGTVQALRMLAATEAHT